MEDQGAHRPGHSYGRLTVIFLLALLVLGVATLGSTCTDRGGSHKKVRVESQAAPVPFKELYSQGIDRYLGVYTPMLSEEQDDVFTHTFGTGEGPLCIDGSPYRIATLDNDSPDLLIFLQGGGMCWSELCRCGRTTGEGFEQVGILDPQNAANPFRDFNVVHLNYCDGGLFVSDRDTDVDGDGHDDRFQRGLHNLSAGLDVAQGLFPSPRRVVLMGNSAGGMATIFALPLVRKLYPEQPIFVVNDSGVGIGRPDDPSLIASWVEDWNISAFFPESCPECLSPDGHLTQYSIWQLAQDPNVQQGMLSYTLDSVLSDSFLKIERSSYQSALVEEMRKLEAAHPERSRHWLKEGLGHCFLHRGLDDTAAGVSVADWLAAMLEGDSKWESIVELPSPENAPP